MPIEKRPTHPLPKGPRPGSRTPAHRVRDHETLETVARQYHVPVGLLLLHNFGTTDPAEINWYLREYVGCRQPTRDQRNWCFSSAASPGLIYIPQRPALVMDPIDVIGGGTGVPRKPVDLNFTMGALEFLASMKFAYEFKVPSKPKEAGYFLIQGRFAVEGEVKQTAGVLKTSFKKDQFKASLEKKFTEDTKGVFSAKFDEKSLGPIAEAVRSGSKADFAKALFKPLEAQIKTNLAKWGNLTIVPEAGFEVSETPLQVRISGEFEDYMVYEGAPLKGKFVLKGGFNLGLSAKGWSWIAQKVGRPVLQRFLTTGGRALAGVAQYLAAEGVLAAGVVVAGTVIGTAAVTTLVAWLAEDARRKGELRGLATWYVQAYTNKVMGEARPSGFITGDVKLRDQLIALGEKDAVSDARRVAGMQGTDGEAIEIYRNSLLAENNDRYENVKIQLRRTLEEKSQRLAGL